MIRKAFFSLIFFLSVPAFSDVFYVDKCSSSNQCITEKQKHYYDLNENLKARDCFTAMEHGVRFDVERGGTTEFYILFEKKVFVINMKSTQMRCEVLPYNSFKNF